jgi:hypothetical protein
MTGYELAEQARRRRPGLKVLFTSGFPGTASQPPATEPPGRLLCKPYRHRDLARKVRECLDSSGATP